MLLFIAITAIFNLALGCALGIYLGRSSDVIDALDDLLDAVPLPSFSLPKLPLLKRKQVEDETEATPVVEQTPPPPAPEAKPTVEQEPAPEPAPEPEPESEPPAEVAAEPTVEQTPEPAADETPSKPSAHEVMAGLAAFQAQLANLGEEISQAEEDDAFDDCCERMQQANHEYLDHAQDAIEKLDGDDQAAPVRDAVKAGAEEVKQVSDEFDATMTGEDKESARTKLRELSSTIIETTKSVEESVTAATPADASAAIEEPAEESNLPEIEIDPETSLATLDSTFARLDALLEEAAEGPPLIVASIKADAPKETELAEESTPALLAKIGELIGDAIGDTSPPALYDGDQLFMILPGCSVDEASRRMEQVRQQVEATKFVDGDQQHALTVSCGMAQSAEGTGRDKLQELLTEAIAESRRFGGNRACHHDGQFPAPVMPEDVDVVEKTVTL